MAGATCMWDRPRARFLGQKGGCHNDWGSFLQSGVLFFGGAWPSRGFISVFSLYHPRDPKKSPLKAPISPTGPFLSPTARRRWPKNKFLLGSPRIPRGPY